MDSEPIQRNVFLDKTTVERLNTLNVWGRMGSSELTDLAIRLMYDVIRMIQQETGCDIRSILGQIQSAVGESVVRDKTANHQLGQMEPPVSPELAELIDLISSSTKEVAIMFNDSNDPAQAVENVSNNGGGSP